MDREQKHDPDAAGRTIVELRAEIESLRAALSPPAKELPDGELSEAIAARDREWMEVLHPGNANTMIGEMYSTPEKYRGFRHAMDCHQIEQGEWNGKIQDCMARLSIALYGHDQAYYDADDSDGENWRDNIDRFTLTLVNMIQATPPPPAGENDSAQIASEVAAHVRKCADKVAADMGVNADDMLRKLAAPIAGGKNRLTKSVAEHRFVELNSNCCDKCFGWYPKELPECPSCATPDPASQPTAEEIAEADAERLYDIQKASDESFFDKLAAGKLAVENPTAHASQTESAFAAINESHSRLLDFIRRSRPSCEILSKGDRCTCLLCSVDLLAYHARKSSAITAEKDAEIARLEIDRDNWQASFTRLQAELAELKAKGTTHARH